VLILPGTTYRVTAAYQGDVIALGQVSNVIGGGVGWVDERMSVVVLQKFKV
jgi:hypothetical protein